jgi:glycosyltransferase involved in cell wall biosynthesis
VRDELKLNGKTPLVGFVANMHPDKAPLDFVAAAAEILKTNPDTHFAMAGHGPLTDDIKAKIAELKLSERVHLLGFRRDMVNVMASYDLLLLTSVTREASSTVLKQAGAVGVPAIATDVGGTREVLEEDVTGLVVKPGDVNAMAAAAVSLLNDREKAAAMGAAGKKKVLGEFTPQAIAEKTEAIYWRALAHRDKSRSS